MMTAKDAKLMRCSQRHVQLDNKRHRDHPRPHALISTKFCAVLFLFFAAFSSGLSAGVQIQEITTVAGHPIGVGTLVCTFDAADVALQESNAIFLSDAEGRVCFSAWSEPIIGRALQLFVGNTLSLSGKRLTAHFLFTGDSPLHLTVTGTDTTALTANVEHGGPHGRMMTKWWRTYQAQARRRQQHEGLAYVDTFLVHTLARQLGLSPSAMAKNTKWKPKQAFELLIGSPGLRTQALIDVINSPRDDTESAFPLPREIPWQRFSLAGVTDETVDVEPIAHYVPEECFYIRFGSFSNYYWLTKTAEARDADFKQLLAPISSNGQAERIQNQLGIQELPFAELFGDKIINDIAIIGKDLFLQDGAAIGAVFQSNSRLLSTGMHQLRKGIRDDNAARGAELSEITIQGEQVSLLSTPDNRVRSFYTQRDGFHLVTNCRAIVESFWAIKDGQGALAKNDEFRFAHQQLLNEKEQSDDQKTIVFAYVPRECLEKLAGPQYQIELWRRMRSVAELQAFELAQQLERHQLNLGWPLRESVDHNDILGRIITQGVLPEDFQQTIGSGAIINHDHLPIDSARGARGTFLPIPDVTISNVTDAERRRYEEFANYLLARTPALAPIAATLHRTSADQGVEKLAFQIQVAPFDRTKYGFLRFFVGDPTREHLVAPAQEFASLSLITRDITGRGSARDDYTLVTLANQPLNEAAARRSLIRQIGKWKAYPAYCVSTLSLQRFPIIGAVANETVQQSNGLQRLPFGLWRRPGFDLTAISFHPDLLHELPPEFRVFEAPEPAHIRLQFGNISTSKLAPAFQDFIRQTSRRRSFQNAAMLNSISQQLDTEPGDSWQIARNLLDAPLRCPLEGTYQLTNTSPRPRWMSTAWHQDTKAAQDNDPIRWLRRLDTSVAFYSNRIVCQGEIEMQTEAPAKAEGNGKSIFDLFRKP